MMTLSQIKHKADPFELLNKFTNLRQNGINRDEAWYQVIDLYPDIHEVTRKAFLNLARNWERRVGAKYHYRDQSVSLETDHAVSEASSQQVAQSIKNNGLTGNLDPGALRAYQQRSMEQILDQVDSQPSQGIAKTKPIKNATASIGPLARPDFFGPNTHLQMCFSNRAEPMIIQITGSEELVIGRSTPNVAMQPEIDLGAVNAEEYGVSRMHAAITRQDNKLLIVDLGSMNHTRVNGVRLIPDEIKTLQDGDEIWFAHMRCKIRFRHV